MIDEIFQKFQPNSPFLIDRKIRTNENRLIMQEHEKPKILQERLNYYQQ